MTSSSKKLGAFLKLPLVEHTLRIKFNSNTPLSIMAIVVDPLASSLNAARSLLALENSTNVYDLDVCTTSQVSGTIASHILQRRYLERAALSGHDTEQAEKRTLCPRVCLAAHYQLRPVGIPLADHSALGVPYYFILSTGSTQKSNSLGERALHAQ